MPTTLGSIYGPSWNSDGIFTGLRSKCRGACGTGRVLYIGVTDYSATPRERPDRSLDYPFYMIPVIIEGQELGRFANLQYDSDGCPDPVLQSSVSFIGRTSTGVPICISEKDRYREWISVWVCVTDRDSAPDRQAFMKELGALTYDEYRELEKALEVI